MTLLQIDLSDVAGGTHPDDTVVVWSPVHREGSAGRTVSPTQHTIRLAEGVGEREVEPGPLMVQTHVRAIADTRTKEVVVPDQDSVTLWDLLEQDFTYTPPVISEVSEARAEVREAVARVGSAEQVETWASDAQAAASTAEGIASDLPTTIATELDTRVPPEVAEALSTDQTIRDAATLAVNDAVDAGLPGKADTTYVDAADQELGQRITDEKWFRGNISTSVTSIDQLGPGSWGVGSTTVVNNLGLPVVALGNLEIAHTAFVKFAEFVTNSQDRQQIWRASTNNSGVWQSWERMYPLADPDSAGRIWSRTAPITLWGDSLVNGGDNGNYWPEGENLPGLLDSMLTNEVRNQGIGGQSSTDILMRAGILEVWVTPVGGAITNTDPVELDLHGQRLELNGPRAYFGSLAGVRGSIYHRGDELWEFDPYSNQEGLLPVPVDEPARLVIDGEFDPGETHIFLMGDNDRATTYGTASHRNKTDLSLANYVKAIEAVPADPVRHVLVAGVKTRRWTTPGDEVHQYATAVNDALRRAYPQAYVDRQGWLVTRGLAAAGISPTAEDEAKMAAGLVPPSAFADETHIRREVVAAEAKELWAPILVERGWAGMADGATLPSGWEQPEPGPGPTGTVLGTGQPEGSVAAPIGTEYVDLNATRGAVRWVKASGTGNTGWKTSYADTGWRDISTTVLDGWAGNLRVRRIGSEVTVSGTSMRPPATGTSSFVHLPAGFRPDRTIVGLAEESGAVLPSVADRYSPWAIEIRGIKAAQSWVATTLTFFTNDSWPTTLPGTPA